jgi:precorrin-2 dehydrogenase/sirohydrochlorin ferrochelatase
LNSHPEVPHLPEVPYLDVPDRLMIPIVVDPEKTPIALIGRGELAVRRLDWLLAGGAWDLRVFADRPEAGLEALAGDRLIRRLPSPAELAESRIVWIADLPEAEVVALAATARAGGALVNVEDVKPHCDFHNPSLVRRGDLLLTVSTGGKSPGLAVRIRRFLEAMFDAGWAERLERIGTKRLAWKRRERSLEELAELTDAVIDHHRWLPEARVTELAPERAAKEMSA